uniref:Multicopper oxidase n=1 Tax=Coniochaeta hoffmannii TaxID=91930 RepID=A0A2I7VT73_9PEZI|nr:multicopper oxidase [Coniochaeta hoffmannii]
MLSLLVAVCFLACGSYASKTVYFSLTLTWEPAAPDGFTRNIIKMNGQFPGPELVVDQGDDVEFLVWNNMANKTSVHFHGIEQINTPWSDGVSGLTQRPIPPGETFLYRWTADEYGSYFYHAHEFSQIVDGLFGPIYVRPAPGSVTPFSLISTDPDELAALQKAELNTRPIQFNTWNHLTSSERIEVALNSGLDTFCANSMLINGKGSSICLSQAEINANISPVVVQLLAGMDYSDIGCLPAPIASAGFPFNISGLPDGVFAGCHPSTGDQEVLVVDPADNYARFDLHAIGQLANIFSIDEHPMTVVAIDGRWVTPTTADAILMNSGQRYSVVVKLDKPPASYTFRSVSGDIAQIMQSTGVLAYSNAKNCSAPVNKPSVTLGGTNATADTVFLDETKAKPFPPVAPSMEVDDTFLLHVDNAGASWRWKLGNESFPINLGTTATPLLFDPTVFSNKPNLTISNKNGSWVDLVIQPLAPISPAHPIHKHSNKFFVVGAGTGVWNYSSVAEAAEVLPPGTFNFVDPPIRDTFSTLATIGEPGWLVLRYQSVNPGAYLLHCHIQDHLYGGMAIALLDGVDEFPEVPGEYLCGNGFRGCAAKPGGK